MKLSNSFHRNHFIHCEKIDQSCTNNKNFYSICTLDDKWKSTKILLGFVSFFIISFFTSCESKTDDFQSTQPQYVHPEEKDIAASTYQILLQSEASSDTIAQNNAIQKTIRTAKEKHYPKLYLKRIIGLL